MSSSTEKATAKTDQLDAGMPSEDESRELHARRKLAWDADKNCLSYWWPRIKDVVPTPDTKIVPMDLTYDEDRALWDMLDGRPPPKWFNEWVRKLQQAAVDVNGRHGPWFLRTGLFSGKHCWVDTCAVKHLDMIHLHVFNIFEQSQLVDLRGLAYDIWAVREWLPGPAIGNYAPFRYMPLRREFRVFAKAGEVLCWHPYWPPEALMDSIVETPEYQEMCELEEGSTDYRRVMSLAKLASQQVPEDEWSVDVLYTTTGWHVTDMALANRSYHDQRCPRTAQ